MMTDKEAITILVELLKKDTLTPEEQEALRTALGLLSWTKFVENKLEARKKRTPNT